MSVLLHAGHGQISTTVVSRTVRCRLTWFVSAREMWSRKEGKAFPVATPHVSQPRERFSPGYMSSHTGAFSCGGFLSLYLSGKLHLFGPQGRGQAWRLCAVLAPLLTSCVASLTRLQDHKHHWEGRAAYCMPHNMTLPGLSTHRCGGWLRNR